MKKLMIVAAAAAVLVGCASDRAKNCDVDGMYVNGGTGSMALGSIELTATPTGGESFVLKVDQDTPWVNPTGEKMNHARCMMTGSNTCSHVEKVVEHLCKIFVPVSVTNVVTEAK